MSSMDIPISRLNQRMALRLPPEFPLGLVFVVGRIDGIERDEEQRITTFFLTEETYRLRCKLSDFAIQGTEPQEGDAVRAGGHLAFDITKADYYLMARDVEPLVSRRQGESTLADIIADAKKRADEIVLTPAELPQWVKELAPPQIREELEAPQKALQEQESTGASQAQASNASVPPIERVRALGLSDEMFAFISEAMDSYEEVELTPEILSQLSASGSHMEPEQEVKLAEELEALGFDIGSGYDSDKIEQTWPASEVAQEMFGELEASETTVEPQATRKTLPDVEVVAGEEIRLFAGTGPQNDLEEQPDETKAQLSWPVITVILFLAFAIILLAVMVTLFFLYQP